MYGLDLRDVLWGDRPWGARRLLSHVEWLPKDSAVHLVVGEGWSQEDELLATIVDLIGVSNNMTLAINSKEGAKLPDPVHFPRPWEEEAAEEAEEGPRAQSSPDEVRAVFGTQASDPDQVVMG